MASDLLLHVPPDLPLQLEVARRELHVDLSRPRQIAFLQDEKRLVYDFRSRRVERPDGGWSPPAGLADVERNAFLTLVHLWEAMNLALRGHHADTIRIESSS